MDSNISVDVSSASSFWKSSDDGDLSTGLDSEVCIVTLICCQLSMRTVMFVMSGVKEVLKKRPRLDAVAPSSSAITRSHGRGKRYVTAQRKTGKWEHNGGSEMSSDEEDYTRGHIVGRDHRRGGADGGRHGGGGAGAGAGCGGGGGRGKVHSRCRGGGGGPGAGCGDSGGRGRVHSQRRGGGGRRGKKASCSCDKSTRGGKHSRLQANDTVPVSITEKDTSFIPGECFCPLRQPGVYVPQTRRFRHCHCLSSFLTTSL